MSDVTGNDNWLDNWLHNWKQVIAGKGTDSKRPILTNEKPEKTAVAGSSGTLFVDQSDETGLCPYEIETVLDNAFIVCLIVRPS